MHENFVKGTDKDGEEFKYLQGKFLALPKAKLQADIFDGFQIRELLKDGDFERSFSVTELQVWKGLKAVIQQFLGNNRASNYKQLVTDMLDVFQNLGAG